ncbi:MAG TPA: ABC transporter substrate-binding protein [Thermomicrobiales bacterium]|nr:ABC transporter substrate-binding protein [Thermomicrobiales bacterium]
MSEDKRFDQLMEQAMTGRLSRRSVLRRATALGLSIPAISMLLAACGDEDPTATTAAAVDPTPTAAAADETEEMEGTEEPEGTEDPGGGEFSLDNPPEVANAEAASTYTGAQLTYYGDGVGIGSQIDETLAAKFNEATGVQIRVIPRPDSATETYANYQRIFQAQSADMDVLMVDVIWPGAFATHLADLSDAFADDIDMWYDTIVENNTIDGRFVGAPWFGDFGILYYRTDLLEAHGFSGPPTTWDELEEMAQTILDAERANNPELQGFVFQGNAYEGLTCNALEWVASAGGGTIVEDGAVTIDNDAAKAILNQARGWVGEIAPRGVTGYQEEDARNAFQGGNAVFMRNWPYAYSLGNSDDSAVAGNFDVAPLPTVDGNEPVGTLGGWQLAVSEYSENREAAIEFVRYMTSPEVVKWRAIAASFVPLVVEVAEDPQVIEAQPYLENLANVVRVTRPSADTGELYNEVSTEIFQGVNEILNGADANSVVPDIASRIESIIG